MVSFYQEDINYIYDVMNKIYKVEPFDETYKVTVQTGEEGEPESAYYGTLADCLAYIQLHEQGYMK